MKAFKLLIVLVVCAVIVLATSCKPKATPPAPVPSFTLQIKAKYGNQSFALNSPNTDSAGRVIVMDNFTFYMSNICLIKTDGSKVNIDSVALINFSDTTTLSITVNNVTGSFTGITFGCGVDSLQNTDRTDSAFPSPYNYRWDTYWSMLGYRFEVLDGKWDTALVVNGGMRNALDYHVGTNPVYRQTQVNKNFSVCCGTNTNLNLYVDVAKIFSNTTTGEALDISVYTQQFTNSNAATDPPACLVTMKTFADNFSNSFTF